MGARPLRWLATVFLKRNIKILKSVKLKEQDVSSKVLVTAIVVKCDFTLQVNANHGEMLNIVTPGWGTGN